MTEDFEPGEEVWVKARVAQVFDWYLDAIVISKDGGGAEFSIWPSESDIRKSTERQVVIDISEARKRAEVALEIIKRIDDAKDPVVKVGAASIVINRDVPQLAQDLLQALEEIENLRIWKDDHVE